MTHPLVKFGDVVHLNTSRLADPATAGIERLIAIGAVAPTGRFAESASSIHESPFGAGFEQTMTYWRLHYHLIWATFERQPTLTLEREKFFYSSVHGSRFKPTPPSARRASTH